MEAFYSGISTCSQQQPQTFRGGDHTIVKLPTFCQPFFNNETR